MLTARNVIFHGHFAEMCFKKLVTSYEAVFHNSMLFNCKDSCYFLLFFPLYSEKLK